MARKDDGALTPEQCNAIHDKIWHQPRPALKELAASAELHRLNLQGHRDQIREKTQHPRKAIRRTEYDLMRAEELLRSATLIAEYIAEQAKQDPAPAPPLQPDQSVQTRVPDDEPVLDL